TATLTLLNGQTLPGLLPPGWSPVQSFWLELDGDLAQPATAQLRPLSAVSGTETATLARWDTNRLSWIALQQAPGAGTNVVEVSVPTAGAYTLVVSDIGSTAPPASVLGESLRGSSSVPPLAADLRADGVVDP